MNYKKATGISSWKYKSAFEDEQVEDNGDDRKQHTNMCTQLSDLERWKLHLTGTEIQHQRQKPWQGDTKKNHGWVDSIRQTLRLLQG